MATHLTPKPKIFYSIALLIATLASTTIQIILVNKPRENIMIMNKFSDMVQDRNLMQCLMDKQFKSKQGPCSKETRHSNKDRQLRQVLAEASECPACRRTQYKEQFVACKAQINRLFARFLRFKSNTNAERKTMTNLVEKFMDYVLLLKEFKEDHEVATHPQSNIDNFISDQIYGIQHRGSNELRQKKRTFLPGNQHIRPIVMGHTVDAPISTQEIQQISNGTHLHGLQPDLEQSSFLDNNRVNKAKLQINSRIFINKANDFIGKYGDSNPLSKSFHFQHEKITDPKKVIFMLSLNTKYHNNQFQNLLITIFLFYSTCRKIP